MASLPSTSDDGSGDFVEGRLLDGFLLLAAGGSSSPEDVVSVNLSSLQIVEVAAEDLTFFGNLDSLDVSDNQLSDEAILEQLGRFPRLTRLLLSCNAISALQVPSQGSLRLLETLDLSFNELHGDVLSQLAHLPRLVTLNLTSNCISSVPPEEELYGLQSLEELSLDANDLVQFVQWRALDVLPRLRKLSLASNRVKRLKDDAPDQPGDQISYFQSLEELDLSGNEIVRIEDLPAVKRFQSLRKLNLSDNPCTKTAGASEHTMQGIKFMIQDTKPWYLNGSGCFMKREKLTQPRLKLDRKKLRKVRSSTKVGPSSKKNLSSALQLGILDRECDQLLVRINAGYSAKPAPAAADSGKPERSFFVTDAPPSPGGGQGPLNFEEDYSEGELENIFKAQTAKIEAAFNRHVEEPTSFRRPFPGDQDNQQVALTGKPEEDASGATAGGTAHSGAGAGASSSTRSPSAAFLTQGSAAEDLRNQRHQLATQSPTGAAAATSTSDQPSGALMAALGSSASGANLMGTAALTAAAGGTSSGTLPPIQQPGSRGSSAGGISRSDPMDMLLQDPQTRTKPMPDIGVREAMKALRAAALSEFAVAV